jgi:predicted enzyme related to lactoylglutathione lyase
MGLEKRRREMMKNKVVFFEIPASDFKKAIEKAGGKVITPKHSIGEWGFMADFADPEGNVIALWEKSKK